MKYVNKQDWSIASDMLQTTLGDCSWLIKRIIYETKGALNHSKHIATIAIVTTVIG